MTSDKTDYNVCYTRAESYLDEVSFDWSNVSVNKNYFVKNILIRHIYV